jgi:toxin ParE1/3/4
MAEITWTKLALNDLDKIYDFIGKDSSYYAQKTVEKIFERVLVLNEFSIIGRIVPEFNVKNLRELIEGNHRIVYRISKNKINILRVHHAAKKIKK